MNSDTALFHWRITSMNAVFRWLALYCFPVLVLWACLFCWYSDTDICDQYFGANLIGWNETVTQASKHTLETKRFDRWVASACVDAGLQPPKNQDGVPPRKDVEESPKVQQQVNHLSATLADEGKAYRLKISFQDHSSNTDENLAMQLEFLAQKEGIKNPVAWLNLKPRPTNPLQLVASFHCESSGVDSSIVVVEKDQFKGNPLQWLRIVTDEEAVTSWFLDLLRKSFERDQQGIELTDEDREQLTIFISQMVRFRLTGERNDISTQDTAVPNSLSNRFRWRIWFHGSERFGSVIQFGIYYLIGLGLWVSAYRYWIVRQMRRAAKASQSEQFDRKTSLLSQQTLATFIDYALPALGFIGTIYGLGSAFGAVGIISNIDLTKKMSLMEVLLNLGTAFSTTFWALIGGVLTNVFSSMNAVRERRFFMEEEKQKEDAELVPGA